MSSSDDRKLPHDVAVEILKRLPVKSLLRFRCVCRSWRSTIDDTRFAGLHLSHSALEASSWYLACVDWYGPVQSLCSLLSNESLALPSRWQIEIPFVTPLKCYGIVGSCNGLICVEEISRNCYGRTTYLWNLFTRKHKAVRRSPLEHLHRCVGFGFDARSNDYNIVRIFHLCSGEIKPRVEIYSLNTDSWRTLECELPAFCCYVPAIFLNGNLHWYVYLFNDPLVEVGCRTIVRFDVAGEVFDEMALPEEIFHVDNGLLRVSVAVLNELLAVFSNYREAVLDPDSHSACYSHSVCSVWVMRDYGVPESWTKRYTFEACGPVTRFGGFTRNGELLMFIDSRGQVSWNPITGHFTNLPISPTCDLATVVESLVSP